MAEVREEAEFESPVEDVWKVVGDFAGLIEAMGAPVEIEGEGIGQTRRMSMGAGDPMIERLEERDEDARRLAYSIVSGPVPLVEYLATMQLEEVGPGRTRLTWSGTFRPAPGTTEEDAVALVRAIYQGGIGVLKTRFG